MLNIWIIALFMVVFLRDSLGTAAPTLAVTSAPTESSPLGPTSVWVWVCGLLPYLAIITIVHIVAAAAGRFADRRGSIRAIIIADRTVSMVRPIVLLVHAGNVFVLGWLTAARALVGNLVLVDEMICVIPPLLVFVAGWWSCASIERRVREAGLWRDMNAGRPVYAIPTRSQFVINNIRNQLALSVAPIVAIAAWGEMCERLLDRLARSDFLTTSPWWGWMVRAAEPHNRPSVQMGLQLAGAAIVFLLAPFILRALWDTVRLSPGPLRDRLTEMCRRHSVRVREILVWRTHGAMINGAVVGIWGRARYILLTDALLESMPQREIEAVMAHEIAHARFRHMQWLGAAMLSAIGCAAALGGAVLGMIAEYAGVSDAAIAAGQAVDATNQTPDLIAMGMLLVGEVLVSGCSLALGAVVFGLVSRRFEWQADAFAARALTLMPARETVLRVEESAPALAPAPHLPPPLPEVVAHHDSARLEGTPEPAELPGKPIVHRSAVDAMAGALQSVAHLNYIPRHRPSFRHGSIAQRQRYLRSLVGRPIDGFPIDRTVRWIKRFALAGVAVLIVLIALGF